MKKSVLLMTVIVCLIAFATSSQATIISWNLNYEFSGGTPPESDQRPWLRATFDDKFYSDDTPLPSDTVRLKMEAVNLSANLTGAEYVSEWWFNYESDNDTLLAGNLKYDWNSSIIVGISPKDQNVAGAGTFNFTINFQKTSNVPQFTSGVTLEMFISRNEVIGLPELAAESFDFLSQGHAGNGNQHTAAHVQGIGLDNEFSGKIGDIPGSTPIPEPATLFLLGAGLIGIAGFGRKKLNK